MEVSRVRILLADPNALMREALADVLREEHDIAGTARNGTEILQRTCVIRPDLVLLDVSMGDMSGLEVARRLREQGSTAKIVYLSLHEGKEFVEAAFAAGASGYIFKSQLGSDLLKAIRAVARGETFCPVPASDPW